MSRRHKPLSEFKHFAKITRQVCLRKMAADNRCFESRVFWAMVLWSWCGPEKTDGMVVRKNAQGYIIRDDRGRPIPAQQKDLVALLGLPKESKGNFSRAVSDLAEKDTVWTDKAGVMYLNPDPQQPAEEAPPVISTDNWQIADLVINLTDLPDDPVIRTATIEWLNQTSTDWKNRLNSLRTEFRELVVQARNDGRILINKRSKRSRGVKEGSSSSEEAPKPPEAPPSPAVPPPTTTNGTHPGKPNSPPRLARFARIVAESFSGQGKGCPTDQQIRQGYEILPDDADLDRFGGFLRDRVPRLNSAAGFLAVVREFAASGGEVMVAAAGSTNSWRKSKVEQTNEIIERLRREAEEEERQE